MGSRRNCLNKAEKEGTDGKGGHIDIDRGGRFRSGEDLEPCSSSEHGLDEKGAPITGALSFESGGFVRKCGESRILGVTAGSAQFIRGDAISA